MTTVQPGDASPSELVPVDLDPIPEDPADVVLRRISEFEDTLPDSVHLWRKGDPAPEWMGERPVWAEDHYHDERKYLPSDCYWQSDEIYMPVMGLYGRISDDGDRRIMGGYKVFLRQHHREREPYVIIRVGPKSQSYNLNLTLQEVEDLVAVVELLSDIAKTATAVAAEGALD